MNRDSVDWKGYFPALTTPFTDQGVLDLDAYSELLEWACEQGLHGLIVGGDTGEWFVMSDQERQLLFKRTSDVIQGRLPVIAGCNAYTAKTAVTLCRVAKESNLDGAIITPPAYIVPSENEVYEYFHYISSQADFPLCVYNWPAGTNMDMSMTLLRNLAELESVVAIKNATVDVGRFCDMFFELKDKVRMFSFASHALGRTLIRHHGLDGTFGAGAILGSEHAKAFEMIDVNALEADRLFERDLKLAKDWFLPDMTPRFGGIQAIFKAALNLQGLPGGVPRKPSLRLTDIEQSYVKKTLSELAVI